PPRRPQRGGWFPALVKPRLGSSGAVPASFTELSRERAPGRPGRVETPAFAHAVKGFVRGRWPFTWPAHVLAHVAEPPRPGGQPALRPRRPERRRGRRTEGWTPQPGPCPHDSEAGVNLAP